MNNSRIVKAKLVIECDVLVDDEVIQAISNEYTEPIDDKDAAEQILFSSVNPKLLGNIEEGSWEGICDFRGKFDNLQIFRG